MSGYSSTPLPKKLGITGEAVFTLIDPPAGFHRLLGEVGDAVEQRNLMPPIDVVVAFFTQRAQLVATWPRLTAAAAPDGAVWVCWPKRSSPLAGELTEDVLRAELLPSGWVENKVCAIDDDWSGLRFVLRREHRDRRRR